MTVPHTSGTITLVNGSAEVTGIDTAWAAALIVGGILFVNVANVGAVALPIQTVDSNSKITAAIPWNGANGTYTYALVRDGSYERQSVENAIKVATLLNEIRSLALTNLSTLTPAADKLPYFGAGGAAAMVDFNADARLFLAGGVLPDAQLPDRIRVAGPTLSTANALDAVSASGWSYVATANVAAVNGPPGAVEGMCLTMVASSSKASQIYLNIASSDNMWTRRKTGSVWSAWTPSLLGDTVGNIERGYSVRGRISTNGISANANDIVRPGIYYAQVTSDATTANNFPVGGIGVLEVTYALDPNNANAPRVNQRWTSVNFTTGPDTWQRSIYNVSGTNTFGPWVKLFHSRNILGTVSQTAGVPTGAIIERGSNGNGEYTRYADGTQICFRSYATGGPSIQPGGYAYLTSSGAALPAAFTYATQFVSYNGSWSPHALASFANNTLTNAGELYLKNTDTAAHNFVGFIFILTVGRWF